MKKESEETERTESGISDEWRVIFDDEDRMKRKEHNEALYIKYKKTFDDNAKRWDAANPERKRAIKAKYDKKRKKSPRRIKMLHDHYKRQMEQFRLRDLRPRVICLYGLSGVGKTSASRYLESLGCNVVCSYTTRPKRDGERNGIDHYFVNVVPPEEEMLAYTRYGNYEYWALTRDLTSEAINVYVVDEAGINEMSYNNDIKIFPVRIERPYALKRRSGVSRERIKRDESGREKLKVRVLRVIRNKWDIKYFREDLKMVLDIVKKR